VAIPCPNSNAIAPFDSRTCNPNGIVPAMRTKYVHQSSCEPRAKNSITVTFSSNAPLTKQCQHPCLEQAKITIKGLSWYSMDWALGQLELLVEYLNENPNEDNAWAHSMLST